MEKLYIVVVLSLVTSCSTTTIAQSTKVQTISYRNTGESIKNNNASDLVRLSVDKIEDAVELFWEAPDEQTISSYEIQRSANGELFESIAFFESIGEAGIGGAYLYLDESRFTNDIAYYRIKLLISNGQHEYSSVQIIDLQSIRKHTQLSSFTGIKPSIISANNKPSLGKTSKLPNSGF